MSGSTYQAKFEGTVVPFAVATTGPCAVRAVQRTSLDEDGRQLALAEIVFEIDAGALGGRVEIADPVLSTSELRGLVTRVVQQELDVLGFERCEAMFVNIHRWEVAGMPPTDMRDEIPELVGHSIELASGWIRDAMVHPEYGPWLGIALGDLRAALRDRDRTSMHCGRTVESLRQAFAEATDGDSRKASWARMRDRLVVDEADLKRLTDASKGARHGEMVYLSGAERLALIRDARAVVTSYARYVAGLSSPRGRA